MTINYSGYNSGSSWKGNICVNLYFTDLKGSQKESNLPKKYFKNCFLCQIWRPTKLQKIHFCTPCSYFTLHVETVCSYSRKQFPLTQPFRWKLFILTFTCRESVWSYLLLQGGNKFIFVFPIIVCFNPCTNK